MRRLPLISPSVRSAVILLPLVFGCAPKGEATGTGEHGTDGDGSAGGDVGADDTGTFASGDTGQTQADDTAGTADSHYLGGWPVDACNDSISATGNEVGDIALDWTRMDQYGDDLRLHDFCDHAVLLVGSAFW